MKLVCMIEILDPRLTAGLATVAALAGWLASRRWHLVRMRNLQASHQRQNSMALGHLAESRRQISSLKKEIADLQAKWLSMRAPRPLGKVVGRTVAEAASPCQRPGDAAGFPDTEPWDPARP